MTALATLFTSLLATLWFLPAVSAVGSFLVARAIGGDFQAALACGAALGVTVIAFKLLPAEVARKIAAAAFALAALFFVFRRGVRRGAARQAEKEKADADRNVEQAQRARADADHHNADPGRLRDDDGFRRD